MGYLIAQIAVCLLLAALLGGGVGWLLRGRPAAPDAGALGAAARRITDLEHELADARRALPDSAADPHHGLSASPAGPVSEGTASSR